jgi:hypothetical protein
MAWVKSIPGWDKKDRLRKAELLVKTRLGKGVEVPAVDLKPRELAAHEIALLVCAAHHSGDLKGYWASLDDKGEFVLPPLPDAVCTYIDFLADPAA